jgi:CRISPR-associated protein (TIGR03984 family)
MNEQKTLYFYRSNELTLSDIINKHLALLKDSIALLYSPQTCQFAKLETNGNLTNSQSQGNEIELGYQKGLIFEARIFNSDYELRWLNDKGGLGKSVLITEQKLTDISEDQELSYLDTIEQKYLLWGEKAKTNANIDENWQRLTTARIGKLDVPINQTLSDKQRVYLNTVEYLNVVDDFGNVSIVEERLINLEVK